MERGAGPRGQLSIYKRRHQRNAHRGPLRAERQPGALPARAAAWLILRPLRQRQDRCEGKCGIAPRAVGCARLPPGPGRPFQYDALVQQPAGERSGFALAGLVHRRPCVAEQRAERHRYARRARVDAARRARDCAADRA